MSQLGRIAMVGDVVEAGGGTLAVTRMDGRRIDRICFHPTAPTVTPTTTKAPAKLAQRRAIRADGKAGSRPASG
ncbi:cobalt ion transmembrane transporter protein [Arthrobacter sp. Hiyo8]|nr:cobalt ion transmembrane transporter protein [Arthrobacter sp. Hiyo8]